MPWDVACDGNWLREEQSTLTAWEKSAEGIVGILQVKLVRHSMSKDGETDMLSRKAGTEGLNGMREQVGIWTVRIRPALKCGRLPSMVSKFRAAPN